MCTIITNEQLYRYHLYMHDDNDYNPTSHRGGQKQQVYSVTIIHMSKHLSC